MPFRAINACQWLCKRCARSSKETKHLLHVGRDHTLVERSSVEQSMSRGMPRNLAISSMLSRSALPNPLFRRCSFKSPGRSHASSSGQKATVNVCTVLARYSALFCSCLHLDAIASSKTAGNWSGNLEWSRQTNMLMVGLVPEWQQMGFLAIPDRRGWWLRRWPCRRGGE